LSFEVVERRPDQQNQNKVFYPLQRDRKDRKVVCHNDGVVDDALFDCEAADLDESGDSIDTQSCPCNVVIITNESGMTSYVESQSFLRFVRYAIHCSIFVRNSVE
jgi:hypothetical protein